MLAGDRDGAAIARRQQRILVLCATVPDRADRVDHMLCGQPVAAGDLRVAGGAAAERAAFGEQLRTRRAMDRAIDASAAKQRGVGGVDDGIDRKRGDVGDDDLELRVADAACAVVILRRPTAATRA